MIHAKSDVWCNIVLKYTDAKHFVLFKRSFHRHVDVEVW